MLDHPPDTDIFNKANPHSMINLMDKYGRDLIQSLNPKYLEMSNEELEKEVYNGSIPETDQRLRISLWKKYDEACKVFGGKIHFSDVYRGLCSSSYFQKLTKDPGRLAYILSTPADYWVRCEDLLNLGLAEMRRILCMKEQINEKTGLPDYNLLKLKIDIYKYVDTRQKGSAVQRIEQQSLNVNVDATAPSQKLQTIDDIDRRIAELESRELNQLPAPNIKLPTESVIIEDGKVTDFHFRGE